MKKTALVLVMAILVFSSFGVSAYMPDENDRYSITYNVGAENAGSMYGIAALSGTGDKVSMADSHSLVYVYQTTADEEGNITFNSFGPMGPDPSDPAYVPSTVFIGGPSFDTAQQIGVLEAAESEVADYVTISGTATDTANPAKLITVSLIDTDGNTVLDLTTDGAFSFNVPAGIYNVKFTKEGFCSYTYTKVAATSDVTLDAVDMTTLAGDIVTNGTVNIMDLSALLADYNKQTAYNTLTNPLSDINGNGAVNIADLSILLGGYNSSDIIK